MGNISKVYQMISLLVWKWLKADKLQVKNIKVAIKKPIDCLEAMK